jgi:D-apiose dehydrogenase
VNGVALVGAGYFAAHHLAAWRTLGLPVLGVCDVQLERAASQVQGTEAAFGELTQMLDATRPSLVDVVLPPDAQGPVLRELLARRLPTICQKPLMPSTAEATAIAQAFAEAGTALDAPVPRVDRRRALGSLARHCLSAAAG